MQGRSDSIGRPRGLAPLRELLDAGVLVAAGGDNVRDPFNPLGRFDPFDVAGLTIAAGHLGADEAYDTVSSSARALLGLPVAGAFVGAQADFVLVPSSGVIEAISDAPHPRIVVHRGKVVAGMTSHRHEEPNENLH
ncbi:amidohydrolase family protein [Microbacterium elymi]|uniref:Amidohydrolase family protein n=1 Tax=Microbacterium elymi TaxID=2909587 RepID=A0ABY5NGI8_9MICO|nr:amidohydrolase family protein [Microbacterium elymi]UUT34294.1 amidohydrolase family protein [Microbacterium elymi]